MAVGTFGVDANGNLSGEEDVILPASRPPRRLATALIAGTCANSAIANQGRYLSLRSADKTIHRSGHGLLQAGGS